MYTHVVARKWLRKQVGDETKNCLRRRFLYHPRRIKRSTEVNCVRQKLDLSSSGLLFLKCHRPHCYLSTRK
jgi:hypothetical protein